MAIDVNDLQRLVGGLEPVPQRFESSYDDVGDVLYVRFEKGAADHSDLSLNDVVLRYREGRLIGITILNASTRPGLHLNG